MPKRYRDINRHSGNRYPLWASRKRSPSYLLRQFLQVTVGTAFDRDPCLHSLRTPALVDHPDHPGNVHRRVVQWTEAPCQRPSGHVRAPQRDLAVHADAAGRTWS